MISSAAEVKSMDSLRALIVWVFVLAVTATAALNGLSLAGILGDVWQRASDAPLLTYIARR